MKPLIKKKQPKQELPTRITNETVAEHRETILAGGRRFKYPLQYAKHRLVINAVIIAAATVALMSGLVWWQLYLAQNTGDLMYRVTKAVPLPVGSVDGESVAYSDYLLNYRPAEHYLNKFDEIKSDSEDGQLQLQHKKREALDLAISDAYARKLARELNLKVTDEELMKEINASRIAENGEQSIDAYEDSMMRILGVDREGTRSLIRNSLLRAKVAFEIDKTAADIIKEAEVLASQHKGDLQKAFAALEQTHKGSVAMGSSGKISLSTSFGGVSASTVAKLPIGQVSSIIKSVTEEGYYIVKLDEKDDKQISFSYILVPLTEFKNRLASLNKDGKIKEYISIKIDEPKTSTTDSEEGK